MSFSRYNRLQCFVKRTNKAMNLVEDVEDWKGISFYQRRLLSTSIGKWKLSLVEEKEYEESTRKIASQQYLKRCLHRWIDKISSSSLRREQLKRSKRYRKFFLIFQYYQRWQFYLVRHQQEAMREKQRQKRIENQLLLQLNEPVELARGKGVMLSEYLQEKAFLEVKVFFSHWKQKSSRTKERRIRMRTSKRKELQEAFQQWKRKLAATWNSATDKLIQRQEASLRRRGIYRRFFSKKLFSFLPFFHLYLTFHLPFSSSARLKFLLRQRADRLDFYGMIDAFHLRKSLEKVFSAMEDNKQFYRGECMQRREKVPPHLPYPISSFLIHSKARKFYERKYQKLFLFSLRSQIAEKEFHRSSRLKFIQQAKATDLRRALRKWNSYRKER